MEKGSGLFVVKNYSRRGLGVDQPVTSEEFFVGGHRWKILLYPGGITTDAHNSGYVSLYLRLNTSTTVQFLFALHLLGKRRDHVFSTFGESLSIACAYPGVSMGY